MIFIKKITLDILLFLSLFSSFTSQAFDWEHYVATHAELKKIDDWLPAFKHYVSSGMRNNLEAVPEKIYPTNFDWIYYKQVNKLKFSSEKQALNHYQKKGFYKKLPYCKPFTFVILLHLHNINLIDELIQQINHFTKINETNKFYIKINIPVAQNIIKNARFIQSQNKTLDHQNILSKMKKMAPHHPQLVTSNNCKRLYKIYKHLKNNLMINKQNIQIIFSENRGFDIGGFLLLLDQLIKEKLPHDFIIKLHTKTSTVWRDILTSFMNIPVNKLLHKRKCLYSNKIHYDFNQTKDINKENVRSLLNYFNLPEKEFDFCGGTMFIASSKFTDFFKNYNLLDLIKRLTYGRPLRNNGLIEHAYERLFGYILDHLDLKKQIIGYHKPKYFYDNKCVKHTDELEKLKEAIEKNNIKIMAIYFPQFHQFPENDALWGKGFTEWTLLNKYQDEIKKPHIDIGEYNMLDFETRKKQAYLAKAYGINAFCYYHYWFNGKKVMHKGVEKILEDGEPNLPFIFCWANEPWINSWSGEKKVLIEQDYGSQEDWIEHYQYLSRFFNHPNYIKEDNCPIIYIYRLHHILEHKAVEMFTVWRELAKKEGFKGLKIISVLGAFKNITKGLQNHIDGFAEHQPTYGPNKPNTFVFKKDQQYNLDIQKFYQNIVTNPKIGNNYTRGIFYSWDNSSRRFNNSSYKFINLSYKSFDKLLASTITTIAKKPNPINNFILLNSWNEWTEQAMVEPNDQDGYKILEIIQKYFKN